LYLEPFIMKKYQIILLIAFGALITLWTVGRVTNAFQYMKTPTSSNKPTFKPGAHFFISNLITPKRLDFICYETNNPETGGHEVWMHRLCGMPGDTLLIKDGDLFINGKNQDLSLNLNKEYIVHFKLVADMDFEEDEAIRLSDDSLLVTLETINHKDLIKQAKKYLGREDAEPAIQKIYHQPWTANNFGPYVVPADAYFVMGDNRNRSQDSRYLGPVKMNKIVATVIR
jgi:signal peptidase I